MINKKKKSFVVKKSYPNVLFFVIREGTKPLSPFDGSYMNAFVCELIVECLQSIRNGGMVELNRRFLLNRTAPVLTIFVCYYLE